MSLVINEALVRCVRVVPVFSEPVVANLRILLMLIVGPIILTLPIRCWLPIFRIGLARS